MGMDRSFLREFVFLVCFFVVGTATLAIEPNEPASELPVVKADVIPCKGMIDDGLFKSIKRRTQDAIDDGADYLIYEIGTYGGLVKAADDISKYLIFEAGKKAHTVAFVTTEAISAGAMISVSCQDIIMLDYATIGCSAPVMLGQKLEGAEREKTESFVRSTFDRAAKANGYPAAVLQAMVSIHKEVYMVKNLETEEYEYFETEKMPTDPNKYDLAGKELVINDKELLTLEASKALKYGIARATVDDLAGALDFLAKRDGVSFAGEPEVREPLWSEQMVRWLNSPAVMGVLVMLAMLAVYMELNTPGLGLPGLVAVICIVVIVGSKYLTGMANWVEVVIFILGILLLTIEVFVLPGFGIAGMLGIICILGGLFGMLIKNPPDSIPWPKGPESWQLFNDGLLGLLFGFTGFLVAAWVLSKYLPRLQFLSGLILAPATAKKGDEVEIDISAPPESEIRGVKPGDKGKVITRLHPAGKAKFGEAIVDVIAEGEFLEKEMDVEIVEIHGNRVVVKQIEDE